MGSQLLPLTLNTQTLYKNMNAKISNVTIRIYVKVFMCLHVGMHIYMNIVAGFMFICLYVWPFSSTTVQSLGLCRSLECLVCAGLENVFSMIMCVQTPGSSLINKG